MKSTIEQKHKLAVANYLDSKIREFTYQLQIIIAACDKSLAGCGENSVDTQGKIVVYGFSSFANAMQALKDAIKTIGATPLTWSDIGQLPHGEFMGKARNAMTHDGNPIVNAWFDGKYFIANDISRLGVNNEPIEIIRPNEDVRTICLQFALGFASALQGRLTPMLGTFQRAGTPFDMAEIESMVSDSSLIPAHVKKLFVENRDHIQEAIENAPSFDPLEQAIANLHVLIAYCEKALGVV